MKKFLTSLTEKLMVVTAWRYAVFVFVAFYLILFSCLILRIEPNSKVSLRKPKVFALQILHHYLTKEGRVRKFSTVYMDKRTLCSKI